MLANFVSFAPLCSPYKRASVTRSEHSRQSRSTDRTARIRKHTPPGPHPASAKLPLRKDLAIRKLLLASLLLTLPAAARTPQQDLEWGRPEEAERQLQKLPDGFLRRSLHLRCLFEGLGQQEAWRALPALEAEPRQNLSKKDLIDFYLLRAQMTAARDQTQLSRSNYAEALECARGTGREIEVRLAALESSDDEPDWAPLAKPTSDYWTGRINLALARHLRKNHQLAAAQILTTQARQAFQRADCPYWAARAARTPLLLTDPRDALGQAQIIAGLLDTQPKAPLLARLRILEKNPHLGTYCAHLILTSEPISKAVPEIRQRLKSPHLTPLARLDLTRLLGTFLLPSGDLTQALQYLDQAQSQADALNLQPGGPYDSDNPDNIRYIRAVVYNIRGESEKSRHELEKLIASPTLTSPLLRVLTYSTLTGLEARHYHLDEARKYFRLGIEAADQSTSTLTRATCYTVLLALLNPGNGDASLVELLASDNDLVEKALRACEAYASLEERRGAHLEHGTALFLKGVILHSLERKREAVETFKQALEILTPLHESRFTPAVQRLLGQDLYEIGEVEPALAQLAASKDYEILASLLRRSGRLVEAREIALKAYREASSKVGPLIELAQIDLDLHENARAEKELHEALPFANGNQKSNLWQMLAQATDNTEWLDQAAVYEIGQGRLGTLPKILLAKVKKDPKEAPKALQTLSQLSLQVNSLERASWLKNKTLKELVDLSDPQQAAAFWRRLEESDARPENEALRTQRDRLIDLREQLGKTPATQREALETQLAQSRQKLLASLTELRQRDPDFETLVTTDASDLLEVQSHLGPDDVVIQLYPGENSLSIQIVRASGVTLREQRVPRERLFQEIRRVRQDLQNPTTHPEAALKGLAAQLLDPVKDLLPARGNLWILPTSELWYVPWDALPRKDTQPLGDTMALACLTSKDLISLTHAPTQPTGPALIIGAPDEKDLPGSWDEVRKVAESIHGQLLLGSQANRATLAEKSRGASLLHLATHSRVDAKHLNRSSLSLADGPLELREIYGYRLAPGALVVLSSCASGLAQDHPGREVTSLAYAFHAAGATSVISTLWPIDDAAQNQLMQAFYSALAQGHGRAQSLAEAKRHLRAQPATAHPFYWAAPYLTGDPR